MEELVVTARHISRAILAGACYAPLIGKLLSEFCQEDLIWAEDNGVTDKADLLSLMTICGSGIGSGYGSVSGFGAGFGIAELVKAING